MQTFTAQLSYTSSSLPGGGERQIEINFLAGSPRDAALGVGDWWANRHWALPDVFTQLLCVKVWHLVLQEFTDTGYLPTSIGPQVVEWKADTAGTFYPNYVDRKLPAS